MESARRGMCPPCRRAWNSFRILPALLVPRRANFSEAAPQWGLVPPAAAPLDVAVAVRHRSKGSHFDHTPPVVKLARHLSEEQTPPAAASDAPMGYLAEVEAFAAVSEAQLSASEWAAAVDAVSHSRGSAAAMFNAVLSALALRRNAEAALDVLKRMQATGCSPDVVSYAATAAACHRAGRVRAVESTLRDAAAAAAAAAAQTAGLRRRLKKGNKKSSTPLEVVFEDDALVAVNKPAGMLVHPVVGASGGDKRTLVDSLLAHCGDKNLSSINGPVARGIVHRLDRGTSGLIVAAKSDLAHALLVCQWQYSGEEHEVRKEYLTLVEGVPAAASGVVDEAVDGLPARSEWYLQETFSAHGWAYSLVRVRILTGRRHQIRRHLACIGHPVCGDPVYRKLADLPPLAQMHKKSPQAARDSDPVQRQLKTQKKPGTMLFLHAHTLALAHPLTGEALVLQAPLSSFFAQVLGELQQAAASATAHE